MAVPRCLLRARGAWKREDDGPGVGGCGLGPLVAVVLEFRGIRPVGLRKELGVDMVASRG